MKKKRSSLFFMPLLVIVALIVLINLFIVLTFKNAAFSGNPIGKRQFELFKTYMQGEKALFYTDQSAKYSLQQSVYDLSKKGGYYDEPDCGYAQGAVVWIAIEKDKDKLKPKNCFPDEQYIIDNLLNFFDEKLNIYLANYPDAYIPEAYDYEVRGNLEVIGKAIEELKIKILPEDFVAKPIQVTAGEISPILNEPMRANPDIETIKLNHPEVWEKYVQLCKKMGTTDILGSPPGVCKYSQKQCCITSGYRHPAYNKEEKGARNSAHQYGTALDIYVGRGKEIQTKWAEAAKEVGFTRVGIYPADTHIHVDTMPLQGAFTVPFWIGRGGKTLEKAYSLAELENKARKYG